MRNDAGKTAEEANVLKVVRPADPQKRSRITSALKNRRALYAGSRPDSFSCHVIYTMSNVNKPRPSLYPSSSPTLPALPAMKPPLSLCLLYVYHFFFFRITVLPSVSIAGARSINTRFLRWLARDWRTALPSMGTKTCREHREQEATNCCKLKNTNAHLSDRRPCSSSLSRLLLPYSGFLPQRLRPLFYEWILVPLPLLIVM